MFNAFLANLVTASKPKKPDSTAAGKDGDSRASTPSKEVTPAEKSTPNLNTSSTSRGRAPKPASTAAAVSTPNQEQNTSREMKRGGSERDSREEGPKYVNHLKFLFQTLNTSIIS